MKTLVYAGSRHVAAREGAPRPDQPGRTSQGGEATAERSEPPNPAAPADRLHTLWDDLRQQLAYSRDNLHNKPRGSWERIRGGEISLMITFSVIGLIANADASAAVHDQQISDGPGLRWPE